MNRQLIPAWLSILLIVPALRADEGMWPLNQLPLETLRKQYDFVPTDRWTQHVQRASVRVSAGGSGSFVSANGLMMTNHHVGSEAIASVSTAEHDYIKDGFLAKTLEDEIKCPGLKLYQLIDIRDVTAEVNAGVTQDMSATESQRVRQDAIAKLTAAAKRGDDVKPDVVKLYHGARYHLYVYKVYDDVRLVMAPEAKIGFFGGDLDNFGYPRYNLDISFFRAYENDAPATTEDYFAWSDQGPQEGELVFMAGHPYRTRRMYTVDHLKFLRDVELPLILEMYNQREVALNQFIQRSDEHKRIGSEPLLYTQNGRKAFGGILAGLLDDGIMSKKQSKEDQLRQYVQNSMKLRGTHGSAWNNLGRAIREFSEDYPAYYLMENRRSPAGQLFKFAKTLVRATAEREKPDGERLEAYREASLAGVASQLESQAPIYPQLEQLMLADALTRYARILGGAHQITQLALAGQTPQRRAAALISATSLGDVQTRKELWAGGWSAVQASNDPLIKLAIALDGPSRALVEKHEAYKAVETEAYAKIADASFSLFGDSVYPDATYTLRLSIGTVQGYEEGGAKIQAMTTIRGAFEHAAAHHHVEPFALPDSWMRSRQTLDMDTPLNFVSTNDIIGGNSGSPTFNRDAQIVGIVFDGNIQSLVWDVQFDQVQARSVNVHSAAILETLRKVYAADALVAEIQSGRK